MAIIDSVSRLAGTLIAILKTRLELITVEVEEESLRFFFYFLFALAAMFCLWMVLLLGALVLVVIYWDTQRVPILISLMFLFALFSVTITIGIRKHYRRKPKMLVHTLKELSRDIEELTPDQREIE